MLDKNVTISTRYGAAHGLKLLQCPSPRGDRQCCGKPPFFRGICAIRAGLWGWASGITRAAFRLPRSGWQPAHMTGCPADQRESRNPCDSGGIDALSIQGERSPAHSSGDQHPAGPREKGHPPILGGSVSCRSGRPVHHRPRCVVGPQRQGSACAAKPGSLRRETTEQFQMTGPLRPPVSACQN